MQCVSCSEEVSNKFNHAITTNICPFCGQTIMDVVLQKTLNDLKILLLEGKDFLPEIENWLLANYSLKKFDPNEEINFQSDHRLIPANKKSSKGFSIRRVDEDSDDDEGVETNYEPTQFAKRAGIVKLQNSKRQSRHEEELDQSEMMEEEWVDDNPETQVPLNGAEKQAMIDIFAEQADRSAPDNEIEKIRNVLGKMGKTNR